MEDRTIASISHKFARAGLIVFALIGGRFIEARSLTIENFDDVSSGSAFSFKDEKGTVFKISTPKIDSDRNNALSIQYSISKAGWGGWGIALKTLNVRDYDRLSFMIKGAVGGEVFEIGIKDMERTEKKLLISQFGDIGKEWKKVKIPLKEFAEINLSSLDNINFAFTDISGKGAVFIDDIQFETRELTESERTATGSFSNKVLIDGFERANPTDIYLAYEGDDSSLKLNSSRIIKEGDFSMELEYTLSTTRPWGSWVSAQWLAKETTLDWRGTDEVKLWVKGDGSGNIMRFQIRDADGETWVYEDREISKSTRWELMKMPLAQFVLKEKGIEKNRILDTDQVRGFSIMIAGLGGSNATSGVKTSVGKIQVDQLYLSGEQISMVWAVPPKVAETEKVRLLKVGNIDFNGFVFTEFLNAPEQKSTVSYFGRLITNGKIGNYSAKIEIASEGQEFGDSTYFDIAPTTAGGSTAQIQNPRVILTNLQLFANNISPYLSQLTVGSLFVDYSPYTFSPLFGFKGMIAEGDLHPVNYHAFVLKHKYDSFTIGSRIKSFWQGFRFTGITVYYREVGKVANPANIQKGNINIETNLRLEETQTDWVYTLDMERPFLEEAFLLGGMMGFNRYIQRATVDRSNQFEPIFVHNIEPAPTFDGYLYKGRFALNKTGIPGLRFNYEYRKVETQFKPRYRQSPIGFDDSECDQRGHNIRLIEGWRGFTMSAEYDYINRISNSVFFRERTNWGIGYYGFDKMDITFNQEIRRETYEFTSNRTNVSYGKNEKVIGSEFSIRAQLSPRTVFFIKPRREDIEHPATGFKFATESLYGRLEFYATSNMKLLGEFKTTRVGVKDFESKAYPYDDNFVRTKIEFNF